MKQEAVSTQLLGTSSALRLNNDIAQQQSKRKMQAGMRGEAASTDHAPPFITNDTAQQQSIRKERVRMKGEGKG